MAIYHQDIADIELNSGSLHRSFLNHSIGLDDAAANRFGVRVFRDGVAETLSGVTCQGFFRNANGENIALTSYGTIDGNVAYVTLPQACYNVEGMFTLAIKLVGGGVTGTMRIVDGAVDNTNTSSPVAPTGSVPTYQEVLSVFEQMQTTLSNYDAKVTEQDGKISDLKSAFDDLEDTVTDQQIQINTEAITRYNADGTKLDKPSTDGTDGDVLILGANGKTQWSHRITPTDEQANAAISSWLEEHPEATTTVLDKAVTSSKLSDDVVADIADPKSGKLLWCIKTKISQADYYALAVSKDGDTFTPVAGYENFLTGAPSNIGTDWLHFEENGTHLFTITYYSNGYDVYVAMTKDFVTWTHQAFHIGFDTASPFESPYVWTPQIFKYFDKYYMAATVQEGIPASRQTIYEEGLERYSGIYCTEIEIDFDNLNITPKGTMQRIDFPAIADRNGTEIAINDYCMDAWFEPTPSGLFCVVNDRHTLMIHVYMLTSGENPMSNYTLIKANLFGVRNIEAPTVVRISDSAWKICACVYSAIPFGEEKNVYCITNDFMNFDHYGFLQTTDDQRTSGVGIRRMRNPSLFFVTDEQQFLLSKNYELRCNVVKNNVQGFFNVYDNSVILLNRFDVSIPAGAIFDLIKGNCVINKISFTNYFGASDGIMLINRHNTTSYKLTYDGVDYYLRKGNGYAAIDRFGNLHGTSDLLRYITDAAIFADTKEHSVSGSYAYITDDRRCDLSLAIGSVSATTAALTVCKLSADLSPTTNVNAIGFVGSGSATGVAVRVLIYASGDVVIYAPQTISGTLRMNTTYLLK